MKNSIINLAFVSFIILSGCDSSDDNADELTCTTEYVPAITLEVKDKATGNFIGCGATVFVEDTDFSEELTTETCDDSSWFYGAFERAGIYDIHVYKEGYLDWSSYNVKVNSGACHVSTVHIVVELEK